MNKLLDLIAVIITVIVIISTISIVLGKLPDVIVMSFILIVVLLINLVTSK